MSKHCLGPEQADSDDNEDREADKVKAETTGSSEILKAIRALADQVGVLSTEQKTLKARLDGKDNTTSSQQEGSGVAQRSNGFYTYVDLMTLLPRKPSQQRENESSKDTSTNESFDNWLEAWSSYERTRPEKPVKI